jgi:hypothetical protein
LLVKYRESGPNPALESALTCMYQLALFIRYVKSTICWTYLTIA